MSKDPLVNATANNAQELFEKFGQVAHGFTQEDVLNAAVNLVINAIRQSQPTAAKAEAKFDELFGRSKTVLMDHYDSLGRKRGIFPYTQNIQMKRVIFPKG